MALGACTPLKSLGTNEWKVVLKEAGNSSADEERYQMLTDLLDAKVMDPAEQKALASLVMLIDSWVNGREKYAGDFEGSGIRDAYLCGFFTGQLSPDKWLLPKVGNDSPLYPLVAFYRARMLIAEVIERGELSKVPSTRARYYGEARKLLAVAAEAYPKNAIIGMYLGRPIPWTLDLGQVPSAPQWAQHQREALTRLQNILVWWVRNRQTSDGQFGGGWGDDVEMWRKWMTLLLAFEEPILEESQARLSEGLFSTDRIKNGYSSKLTDVEHTAEDTADSVTSMMHIAPHDRIWEHRARQLIELMKNKWTGINRRGFLQFKGTYFTADEIDPSPRKACDSVYHPRVIQPALLLWQRTGDPSIGKIVIPWMDTWVDAAQRASKGKPAGILPSAIHWPDGEVGGITDTWWKPGNHTADPLYVWPSAMPMMLDTLLLTWHQTKDQKYLQPLISMLEHFRARTNLASDGASPGTLDWCVHRMETFLPGALAKYRFLSGDSSYDDLLRKYANGYLTFRMNGDRTKLNEQLGEQARAFAFNETAFKEEVRWTDRVFRYHQAYYNDFASTPIPSFDPTFLFQCVSGNIGSALYFPINAVKWKTHSREIAVLVTNATPENFRAEIFHFGRSPRKMGAVLYSLNLGSYQLKISVNGRPISVSDLRCTTENREATFTIPNQELVTLAISAK